MLISTILIALCIAGGALAAPGRPPAPVPAGRFALPAAPAAAGGYPMEVEDGRFESDEGPNAERMPYPASPDQAAAHVQALLAPQARPVPAHLLLVVNAGYGRRRKIRVDAFDEAEIMTAFQTLHAARPNAPLTLRVETDERVTQARFFVKNDQQQLPLEKVKLAVYDAN